MSTPAECTSSFAGGQPKRKKNQRACDLCRRKKIRCDGGEMPNHRCSRCVDQGIECTYEVVNTRPPSKSYVQILEDRLQNMEKVVGQLHPNVNVNNPQVFDSVLDAGQLPITNDNLPPNTTRHSSISAHNAYAISPPPPDSPLIDSDELEPSDDEEEARRIILENLQQVPVLTHPLQARRYQGKSSSLLFLQTVIDTKQRYVGMERSMSAEPSTLRDHIMGSPRRAETGPTSAVTPTPSPYRDWPPPDLMEQLVDAFFTQYNRFVPILHRSTLEQGIKDELHLRDRGFGAVVLLVCANGSRVVDDSRVLTDDGRVAGWRWFEQVETARWSYLERPRLEDLQTCVLISIYLWGTHVPQGIWTVIGLGLRMAQDMGAHRKKMYNTRPTVEDELMKRAFWALIIFDSICSFGLGRPCAIHDEDFDVEPLLEVDDEYWINSDPEQAFKQPEGRPSYVSFANCLIRLLKILAFASRTIYSINKSKAILGMIGPEWEQKIVAELDSALNKWVDMVPPHLQWDPNREDHVFLNQSATLYAHYYLLQICIHRPFIPSPRKPSRLTFPSLAICTNAARSCTHVLDTLTQRTSTPLLFKLITRMPLFTAGLVLLLNVWGGRRSGVSNQSAMADVHKCMNMLKLSEQHTHYARRLWDILNGLISMGELSSPEASKAFGAGQQDVDSPAQDTTLASPLDPKSLSGQAQADEPLLSRLYSFSAPASTTEATQPYADYASRNMFADPSFSLPVHTEELGRLPFHHGFSSFLLPQQQSSQSLDLFGDLQSAAGPSTLPQTESLQGAPIDTAGFDVNTSGFPTRAADLSALLSALSAPSPSSAQESQYPPQQADGAPYQMSMSGDMDVDMTSAENIAFADSMLEMWSTAPTSFELDDWGSYLANMTGVDPNSPFDPPRSPPT
ncbi:fungal-specific transcription factor domain-containing protein [Cerioporus squamosus]|nr:fungal-specific transcription factor domain-containing protein [Cerioporus squamosus]